MAFPEPVRSFPANIKIANPVQPDLGTHPRVTSFVVGLRRWGDDDDLYDHNADGIKDFPERAFMRYGRERRRIVVNQVKVANPREEIGVLDDAPAEQFPGRRVWAGIGGFLFIPSFPQLRRKETIWPDAT